MTTDEEALLLDGILSREFNEVRMRGVAAKGRVTQYGWQYSFEAFRASAGLHLVGLQQPSVRAVRPGTDMDPFLTGDRCWQLARRPSCSPSSRPR